MHLDAHTDAYETISHWLGSKKSAAHSAGYLVRQGNVDAKRSVQIGMRGNPRTRDWLKPSWDLGYKVMPMKRYREIGARRQSTSSASASAIAPSTSPSTSTASIPRWRRGLQHRGGGDGLEHRSGGGDRARGEGLNVIGGDVVCLMPSKDQRNNITAMVAAAVMFEIVSLIADRRPAG